MIDRAVRLNGDFGIRPETVAALSVRASKSSDDD
jgi:hypothetical protein